jgi:GTPase KRas protein
MPTEYKIVIVGGGGVGKSALTIRLIQNHFLDEYDPTIEDTYQKNCTIDNEECLLNILDTAGQEEYRSMRDQYMRNGQGFLVVYSITNKTSFTEVAALRNQINRVKEVSHAPLVICGNKCDLEEERTVQKSEGEDASKQFQCPFYETSAKSNINVETSFFELARQIKKDPNAHATAASGGSSGGDEKKKVYRFIKKKNNINLSHIFYSSFISFRQ